MFLVLCGQQLPTFTRRGNLIIAEASHPQSFQKFAFAYLTDALIQSWLQSRQDTTGQEPTGDRFAMLELYL